MQVRDKLEKLASRNELPEATEGLVSSLLAKLSFPAKWREKYSQRLRYGLIPILRPPLPILHFLRSRPAN